MTQPFHSSGCFPECGWATMVSVWSAVPSPTPQSSEGPEPLPPQPLPFQSGTGWETAEKGQHFLQATHTAQLMPYA